MLPNFRKTEGETRKPLQTATGSQAASPSPAPRASERRGPSLIGSDLTITGNLVSKGEIQIEGEVQGDIRSTNVVVGESANITGSISAEEIVVRGKVMGSVRGKRVLLQTASHVEGDIYHQTLAIEQGAYFEGKSRRSGDPLNEHGSEAASKTATATSTPTVSPSASSSTSGPPTSTTSASATSLTGTSSASDTKPNGTPN